jgi:uncharacterized protein (DUF433 family)
MSKMRYKICISVYLFVYIFVTTLIEGGRPVIKSMEISAYSLIGYSSIARKPNS